MNLTEYVSTLDEETIIHLGSQVAFFFVGNKKEYEERVDELSDTFIKEMKERHEHDEKYLEEVLNRDISRKKLSVERYADMLISHASVIKKVNAAINYSREYIATFKPLKERKVIAHSERIQGDGVVVKITGMEKGRYWDRKEYEIGEGICSTES